MNTSIADEVKQELIARGFSADLESPNGTMGLSVADLCSTSEDLAELLVILVARREKIFRSVAVVGAELARKSYDDVVLVIEAVKAVIGRLRI